MSWCPSNFQRCPKGILWGETGTVAQVFRTSTCFNPLQALFFLMLKMPYLWPRGDLSSWLLSATDMTSLMSGIFLLFRHNKMPWGLQRTIPALDLNEPLLQWALCSSSRTWYLETTVQHEGCSWFVTASCHGQWNEQGNIYFLKRKKFNCEFIRILPIEIQYYRNFSQVLWFYIHNFFPYTENLGS